jgi:hypothetical protein
MLNPCVNASTTWLVNPCRAKKAQAASFLARTLATTNRHSSLRASSMACCTNAVPISGAIKLAFLDHPLMRLGSTFNLILEVVAFGWQKLRDMAYFVAATRPIRSIMREDAVSRHKFKIGQSVNYTSGPFGAGRGSAR